MKDRHQQQWENLGSSDPYWAVLSQHAKKGGKWEKNEFFESGRIEIEQVMKNLAQIQVELRLEAALDFGCGVGRLSRALSRYFTTVIGVDISSSMLREAQAQHREFSNIEFRHNTAEDLGCISDGSIDFVYSNIVLQHMPARRQLLFVGEFCRVLRRDGIVVFQTPSRHDLRTLTGWVHFLAGNRLLNIARRAIYGKHGVMEIHTLATDKVLATFDTLGMSIAKIERCDSAGSGFASFRYYAVKR